MNVTTLVFAVAAAGIGSLLPGAAQAAPTGDRVGRLLDESRAALGGTAMRRVKTLELHSALTVGGINGTGTAWQQIGSARFAESYSIPPLAGGDGYDGTDVWNRDGSGLVWVDGGQSGRAQEINQAFAGSDALWSPDRGGAKVTWGGVKTAGGRSYQVLVVAAPHSAVPFELWFDPATHVPARIVQTIGPVTSTTTLTDYRPVDGLMIPFAEHVAATDGNASDDKITSATANAPNAPARLVKPPSDVHDFSIVGGASETRIPIEMADNHVYLSVMLNGKGPYRFIYDTGGANIVDPAVAREIGAVGHGTIQGGGVGSATESVSFANVDSMQIGAATLRNQLFGVAPTRMGFGMSAGQPVDGLIGFEVLSRFVTTFDYAHNAVILSLPGNAQPSPAADVLPFVLDGRQPQFDCAIDGVASQCTVDTGARDSITLMTPFIAAHPHIVPSALTAAGVNGFGFGGPSLGRLGRVRSIRFGTFTLPDVIADFTTQQKGAFAVPFIAGNVGGNIWRRFTLTLDYAKQTMALTPNAAFDAPDDYERAGLFLLNRGGKYVVFDVRPGTPAARAGILKGDTIDALDGQSASGMSLQAVRQRFFAPAGTVVRVGLAGKDGTKRSVTLTLADFV